MKVRVKNNSEAPQGIEKVDGGYRFIQPGATREVDAANPGTLYRHEFLEVEALEAQVPEMPAGLAAKITGDGTGEALPPVSNEERTAPAPSALDHDGKDGPGGSVKGYHSTAAKGARRRRAAGKGRRKAASK